MRDTLTIGSLAAERGQKLRGWLPVPGTSIQLPLTLIHGTRPGRRLLVTGGIHGGEYPGIEAAIQLARTLDPAAMSGSAIVVSIASPTAFQARMQYRVPEDGLNLNRQFPGSTTGTISQRLAACVMAELASRANAWIDLHGGDIHEELEPFTIYSAGAAPAVRAGDTVRQGQSLGELRDYFGDTMAQIAAPLGGVVLYRVTSLAVDPGDPLVGIGAEAGGD